jgi:hypothetical protein
MDPEILKRYDMTVDNKFIVPVSLPDYRALYEKYDYISTFYKRDLNQELVEYLFYCAREIGRRNDFIIRIDLPVAQKSEPDENDIILSIKKYFEYEISLCRYEIKSAVTRLIFHFAIAAVAFLMWLITIAEKPADITAVYQFFNVGLSVGIWVLLLTGVSRFLFRYRTQTTTIRLCQNIRQSPVEFNYMDGIKA